MESYKHSCPFCGQHVEYTAGYCGKQMTCPICGHTITFPALPPGGFKSAGLRLKRDEPVSISKWPAGLERFLARIRVRLGPLMKFEHWNIVWVCVIPFLIIGGLVIGASFVKKTFDSGPAAPAVNTIQADPNAWQKMTDLARAEDAIQRQLSVLNADHAAVAAAQRNHDTLSIYFHKTKLSLASYNDAVAQLRAADQAIAAAEQAQSRAVNKYYDLVRQYRTLGGTTDYSRLPW